MTTKNRLKKPAKPEPETAEQRAERIRQRQLIADWLRREDLALFLEGPGLVSVLKRVRKIPGVTLPVLAADLRELKQEVCQWWGQRVLPRRSRCALSTDEWEAVERVVGKLTPVIQGLSLSQAEKVVRTRITVNKSILTSLVRRFLVWAGGAAISHQLSASR